jgi:predicted amino acid dehydrogenase
MIEVVSISLGSALEDADFTTRFLGKTLRVRRFGTDGSLEKAERLLKRWEPTADAIALGGLHDDCGPPGEAHATRRARLVGLVKRVPVTTGERLDDILHEWAVRRAQAELRGCFDNAKVLFFSGTSRRALAASISEVTQNLYFADPLLQLGIPKLLTSLDALERYADGTHAVRDWVPPTPRLHALTGPMTEHMLRRAVKTAMVVVAPLHALDRFGLEELAGKTLVTAGVGEARAAWLADRGVNLVVDAAPSLAGHVLAPELLAAMIVAATAAPDGEIADDEVLDVLTRLDATPRLVYPSGFKRVNRFAFVIHPLSQEYFKKVEPVELLSRVSPPIFMDTLEKVLAYAPPFVYSRVTGIRSPTGAEAEGWLISVGGTPREIMSRSPEFTYRRLLDAAAMAKRLGAQIMGLGAFTKVVGDAGVTVARQAPLPITTGNSYSASGALWAAHDALLRLGLLPRPHGKQRVAFKAMVVGATGSIGAACARLLVRAAEEVVLVSPEATKLLALRESILKETPDAKLTLAAHADRHLADMDMVVTATSGAGKKVLDIMKVKPGCVITDVARPLDLPAEEVAKRPDVLVIESGEIQLPGDVRMKNIGLPKGVVYACLAETIVLALEGRFESFTVGRNIEWEKVREIYRLGLRHGMKLAAISGVNGVYSDADIRRVRKLALAARARHGEAGAKARAPRKAAARKAAPRKAASQKAAARRAAARKPAAAKRVAPTRAAARAAA